MEHIHQPSIEVSGENSGSARILEHMNKGDHAIALVASDRQPVGTYETSRRLLGAQQWESQVLTHDRTVEGSGIVNQSLSNVQINGGQVNLIGRDLHIHNIHHYHPIPTNDIGALAPILSRVPNFRKIQIANLGKATGGTGDWIYLWNEFCVWLAADGHIKILWGTGMPGAGKTILASLAISVTEQHARDSPTPICVGFLYIRYKDHTQITARDLLEVLVKQTIERHPGSLPICHEVYERHIREKTEPSTKELQDLLRRFTSELILPTFYFLDALDEAPAKVQLELLETLMALDVKLFITSRPLQSLQARFPEACHFPIVSHESDLEVHISTEISRSDELRAIIANASPGLEGRIAATIKQRCGGMFLHASLQLQALRGCTTRVDLNNVLKGFPPDIADVYAETWNRIINQPDSKASLARTSLRWMVYAHRSLSIEELRYATAICPDTHRFDAARLAPVENLVSACCGLLTVESETGLVRLIHYTAHPILRTLIANDVRVHPQSLLSGVCMDYLRGAGLQQSTASSREELDETLGSSPLLSYAYRFWGEHACESLEDQEAASRIRDFVQGCKAFPIAVKAQKKYFGRYGSLHVAAFYNLPLSFAGPSHLKDINAPSEAEPFTTALHLACLRNSLRTAQELLARPNIQINASDQDGWTPLICVSYQGSEDMAKLFLSRSDVKVNQARNVTGEGPLHFAAHAGHLGVMKHLLAHPKVKVNMGRHDDATPLILACQRWSINVDVVNLFVSHPRTKINATDRGGGTALYWAIATKGPSNDGVRALLTHPKVNLDAGTDEGRAVWKQARRRRIHQLLLDHIRERDAASAQASSSVTERFSLAKLRDAFAPR